MKLRYRADMQATVATFDPDTRGGTLLTDDGTEVPFGPEAFAASGLRLLRLGQRVDVRTGADGTVTRVGMPGIE